MNEDFSSIQVSYLARIRLAICLIVLLVLSSSLLELKSDIAILRSLPKVDDISAYEQRFESVKPLLPSGRIVPYSDDFGNQCKPFVLAQYALAPVILAMQQSKCGHIDDNAAARSITANLLLENSHSPEMKPYELRLFPEDQQEGGVSSDPNSNRSFLPGGQSILLKDSGNGVKLYALERK